MNESFEDGAPLIIFLSVIFVLIGAAVGAYVLSSKRSHETVRRRASWVAALVSALIASIATIGYAIPVLEDFRIPGVPFKEALLGTIIVWAICLGAWVIAVRCTISALGQGSSR